MTPTTFCTLFDSAYLPKGLALHASLRRWLPEARLLVCCFDDRARSVLDALRPEGLTAFDLSELEAADPQLAAVRGDRSAVEYCWTATPALTRHVLDRETVDAVTYLDADLWFASSPAPLFQEAPDASILLTEHGFAPEYAHHAVNGIFNVQFMTFRADHRGRQALDWWHDRCVEWCGAVPDEQGRFGDQKYLDDWPSRFAGVHVLRHRGAGLAPWNARARRLERRGATVTVDGAPLVFAHLHGLQLRSGGRPRLYPPGYRVPRAMCELVYEPYLAELRAARDRVQGVAPDFDADLGEPLTATERWSAARAVLGERVNSVRVRRRGAVSA